MFCKFWFLGVTQNYFCAQNCKRKKHGFLMIVDNFLKTVENPYFLMFFNYHNLFFTNKTYICSITRHSYANTFSD